MPSLFSRIIAGDIPGRFLWRDELCVAFLNIAPLTPGHALVVSRAEVEEWTQADGSLLAHLMATAQAIGAAQQAEWGSPRVGLMVQGFEVPHLHLHVWPAYSGRDFDLSRSQRDPDPADLDAAAARLRARLRAHGHGPAVADEP
jgi:diadenosine tetraphosphate (Ap4A) HIT family hydrolase